jgi:hypothetical protein
LGCYNQSSSYQLIKPVRGDFKSVIEIKKIYEEVYKSPLHLKRLGSLDELYGTVKEEFEKDSNNIMAWAPG